MSGKVVLVSGKAQAGKDTLAGIISSRCLESDFRIMPFSAELKATVGRLWGLDFAAMTADEKEERRGMLIRFGQMVRQLDPFAWVDTVCRRIDALPPETTVVIPDCRFWNEIGRVLEWFGPRVLVVRVSVGSDVRAARMGETSAARYINSGAYVDPSETQLDPLDGAQMATVTREEMDDVGLLRHWVHRLINNGDRESFASIVTTWWSIWGGAADAGVALNIAPRLQAAAYRRATATSAEFRLVRGVGRPPAAQLVAG